MPTYDVKVRSPLLDEERHLRVPAPDAGRARRRGARRALALAEPDLGPTVGAEEFNRVADHIAVGTEARRAA